MNNVTWARKQMTILVLRVLVPSSNQTNHSQTRSAQNAFVKT